MPPITLNMTPLRSGLIAGRDTIATVLIRGRAPAAPEAETRNRYPLNVAIVIDRSGSMAGQPLAEAKRCAEYVVNGLSPSDTVSVVTYDDCVDVCFPSRMLTDKQGALAAIRSIRQGGTTALFDGWRLGADQALFGHSPEHLSRVLLLSDGNANRGLRHPDHIASRVAEVAEGGVSTSTYGLGHRFNEDLMMAMARAGRGNGYYGQSAEDLMDLFREEFDLMNSLCARNLSLTLEVPPGIEIRLLNQYPQIAPGRWQLPDLACGTEVWALAELHIPADLPRADRSGEIEILRANLEFEPLTSGASSVGPERLVLPFMPADVYGALEEDETVRARAQELRAAELQQQAREAARHAQWDEVDALLGAARQECDDNAWVRGTISVLEEYAKRRDHKGFRKEAMYTSVRMRGRLADPNELVSDYDSAEERNKSSFLRRKFEQGKRLDP